MPMNPRLLRPKSSGFNPKSLPGFVYWLDASQSSTITVSTGVAEWRDAAGSAIKATQGTAAAQPAYQTAAQNGKNAVYFDGSNDNVQLGNLSASFPSAATAIFAYKPNGNDTYSLYTDNNNSAFWAYPTGRTYIGTFKATRLNNVASPLMPIDRGAVVAIVSSSSGYQVYVNNTLAHNVAADFQVGTNHRIGVNDLGTSFRGWLCEAIFSSSALNASQLTAAYKYLDAKWNLSEAVAPTVSNADAQDWINRVYANGGTVSASTASAVNTFCNDIDAAGIRDRFYRLNLFCGTGLSACLVPLYRGQSRTGTQFGNATDTNNGPFVSGDYNETGTSSGFLGAATKYLNTGVKANDLTQSDRHLSVVADASSLGLGSQYSIGGDNFGAGGNYYWGILAGSTAANMMVRAQASAVNSTQFSVTGKPHVILSGNGSATVYRNGSSVVTGPAGAFTAPAQDIWVLGLNRAGSLADVYNGRISSYSIGLAFTASQALSYYNAISAFQTALSRA